MIYDVTTYNGESDLMEIRLNILDEYVDKFIIVEFDKTFSSKPKPSYYLRDEKKFEKWAKKIEYYRFHDLQYEKYRKLAESSPNTKGASHWTTEFMQKESIKDALKSLNDDDTVFIGDTDEIWRHDALKLSPHQKLKLKVYTYFLNNRSSEQFWGTLKTTYGFIKDDCLNHARTLAPCTTEEYGWHFTSMYPQLPQKLTDSYSEESYATKEVLDNLNTNITLNKDFLGRNFTYKVEEDEWPGYLIMNREKYLHLLK